MTVAKNYWVGAQMYDFFCDVLVTLVAVYAVALLGCRAWLMIKWFRNRS